jgi:hypothetical protein
VASDPISVRVCCSLLLRSPYGAVILNQSAFTSETVTAAAVTAVESYVPQGEQQ